MPDTAHYLILSGAMFSIGLVGVIVRRNMIVVLMSLELMLNAVNINMIAFSHHLSSIDGQVFTIFIIAIAAGEAAVGLAILIQLYRLKTSVNLDEVKILHG